MRRAMAITVLLLLAGCVAQQPPSPSSTGTPMPTPSPTPTTIPPSSQAPTPSTPGALNPFPVGTMRLTAIDIGQGAAILMEFPDANILVDAANRNAASTNALLAYLQSRGITHLDAIIISNPDADHAGACNEVFRDLQVDALYHQGYPKQTITWQECLAAAQAEGSQTYTDTQLNPGDLLPLAANATIRLLNINAGGSEVNPGSIAIRVDYGDFSFILPGDIECEQEDKILAAFDVDVDVIQVAHHGSKYGTCNEWLDATTPQAAFIPVGANTYGHPTQETLDRLAAHAVTVYRTDLHGDITFTSNGQSWTVATERTA